MSGSLCFAATAMIRLWCTPKRAESVDEYSLSAAPSNCVEGLLDLIRCPDFDVV